MNIVIVGAGSLGTALSNILAKKKDYITLNLLARKKEIVDSINNMHINEKYFPNFRLEENLVATLNREVLLDADIVFLAIPSACVIDYVLENRHLLKNHTIIVILSKGFGRGKKTIFESLNEILKNPLCSLKGPTFASDLIHNNPSAFTIASKDDRIFPVFMNLFENSNIFLDFSTDITGVEVISALKNIYAILLGIIDAYFNSANVRFFILSRAFREMRDIIMMLGGREETLFKYCGFGDFSLTALNDLSRNRTLGLLVGKGFLNSNTSNSVILEGIRTMNTIYQEVCKNEKERERFLMIDEIHTLFNSDFNVPGFIHNLFKRIREPS
jgi:glycerol-3-phosphate dehydrogenase (NAD(P)+)